MCEFSYIWLSDLFSLSCRHDLQPVIIRICNKVDPHLLIFKADASHLLVLRMGRLKIIHTECQMELIISQIIMILLPVPELCEL